MLQTYRTEDNEVRARLSRKVGITYERLGNVPQSLEWLERARAIVGDSESQHAMWIYLDSAGVLYRRTKDRDKLEQALELAQKGIDLAESLGDQVGLSHGLNHLGTILSRLRRYPEARDYHQWSLEVAEEAEDLLEQSKALNNLGADYHFLKEPDKAVECYQRAIEIKEQIGDIAGKATSINNIGEIEMEFGSSLDLALRNFIKARGLFVSIGYRLGEALTYFNAAQVYARQNNKECAWNDGQTALEMFQEIGVEAHIAATSSFLDNLSQHQA